MALVLWTVLLSSFLAFVMGSGPLVMLSHGGKLQGKRFTHLNTNVDLFLGVPYAAPPVGNLRFKKPAAFSAWTGVRNAVNLGNICPQQGPPGVVGDEDCLFLDITVPRGGNSANKKAVMVWIPGGGYISGFKDAYIPPSLAVTGDVIVVAINYRLGILGFLSEGPGTGNFGLWDQRAALVWVKANIAQFGGDPDMVTIFGESAGAGSVAAQTMSPHNDRLFKRAIQESGSLYNEWSWYLSQRKLSTLVTSVRRHNKCAPAESLYQCLRSLTVDELFSNVQTNDDPAIIYWHPLPDGDFFAPNITDDGHEYDISTRFDLLAGFNAQEGGVMLYSTYLQQQLESSTANDTTLLGAIQNNLSNSFLENGTSLEFIKWALFKYCERVTPLSVELCVHFLLETYKLNSTDDDMERGQRLTDLLGEVNFNVDAVQQLSIHSMSSKSTYAYYFTEPYSRFSDAKMWKLPSWLQDSADHVDEVPFVFGYVYNEGSSAWKEYLGDPIPDHIKPIIAFLNDTKESDEPLTNVILTMWTNFAKSGNPNRPVPLPVGTPAWPEFDTNSNQFMELNGANTRVITTPHKERLEAVLKTVNIARAKQVAADNTLDNQCSSPKLANPGMDVFG